MLNSIVPLQQKAPSLSIGERLCVSCLDGSLSAYNEQIRALFGAGLRGADFPLPGREGDTHYEIWAAGVAVRWYCWMRYRVQIGVAPIVDPDTL